MLKRETRKQRHGYVLQNLELPVMYHTEETSLKVKLSWFILKKKKSLEIRDVKKNNKICPHFYTARIRVTLTPPFLFRSPLARC